MRGGGTPLGDYSELLCRLIWDGYGVMRFGLPMVMVVNVMTVSCKEGSGPRFEGDYHWDDLSNAVRSHNAPQIDAKLAEVYEVNIY
jgi:hypothetical protein